MCYPEVVCPRCKGTRYMKGQVSKETYTHVPNYKFNKDGLCFACDGDGTLLKRPDGKLVRRDLDNGNWLSYSHESGDYLGVVQPILDAVGEEYEMIYANFKCQEEEEAKWKPVEPVFNVEEFNENGHAQLSHFFEDIEEIPVRVTKPKNNQYSEEYYNPSIEELGRMCGLPEGVGLFDDDR